MLWELKGQTPFQESNSMKGLEHLAGGKKNQKSSMDFIIWAWKTAPAIALNIHKTSQRQNAGAPSDRMPPGLRGYLWAQTHREQRGQRCFLAEKFQLTRQREAAALNGISCLLKRGWRRSMSWAKIDFHQHKKNADVTEFVIKVPETYGFSCLTLFLTMNQAEDGAYRFTAGTHMFVFYSSLQ